MDWTKGYDFDDVLLIPNYSDFTSRLDPSTETEICRGVTVAHPIVPANMDCIATPSMFAVQQRNGGAFIAHRFYEGVNNVLPPFKTFGLRGFIEDNDSWWDEVEFFCAPLDVKGIVIDIQHAHNKFVLNAVRQFKYRFGDSKKIIVGNIAAPRAAQDLCTEGVDAVKVGIGPGYACTTRDVTGVGVPQLTAIKWCHDVCKDFSVPIIADGGITKSGDITKAIAAGADTVMIGSMLGGSNEAGGESVTKDGGKPGSYRVYRAYVEHRSATHKKYWGQSSEAFQLQYYGSVKDGVAPEGEVRYIELSGPAEKTINTLLGGLRSGMTYLGASDFKKLRKKANFVVRK